MTSDPETWAAAPVTDANGDELERGEPDAAGPTPHELWQQAGDDPAKYLELMREHGHIVPGRRPAGEDVFGHPAAQPGPRETGLREAVLTAVRDITPAMTGDVLYRALVLDAIRKTFDAAHSDTAETGREAER